MDFPPIREELRGFEPYGAPQLPLDLVPVQLNTNENPYGPSDACADDIAAAVRAAATTLNRYPDREHVELRIGWIGVVAALWAVLHPVVAGIAALPFFTGGFFEGDAPPTWAQVLSSGTW